MDTFLTLFSESQLHALLLTESTGAKVVEKFLQILQVIKCLLFFNLSRSYII
jgi:hypothetical protein